MLKIERYLPDLPGPGCCPDTVYAIVFDGSSQALSFSGGQYDFIGFNSDLLNDYKITLAEDAHRTKYYSATISADQLVHLPDTDRDQPWWMEFWLENGIEGRSTDIFQEAVPFYWQVASGVGSLTYNPISQNDLSTLVLRKSHVAVSYDSTNQKLRFLAWLEVGNDIVTDPDSCEVKWLRRDGTVIAHFTAVLTMGSMPGVFQAEQSIQNDVDPDEVMPIQVTIIDADGVETTVRQSVTAWD